MARILIVDDSWLIRKVVGGVLKKEGHEVIEGENGKQCIDLAEATAPDLVVLDLLMPELGGLEVIEALQQKGLDIPVVVLTADIQESTHDLCRELGVTYILQKPPRGPDIVEAVDLAMGQKI